HRAPLLFLLRSRSSPKDRCSRTPAIPPPVTRRRASTDLPEPPRPSTPEKAARKHRFLGFVRLQGDNLLSGHSATKEFRNSPRPDFRENRRSNWNPKGSRLLRFRSPPPPEP